MDPGALDGNATGGLLGEVFAIDMTVAVTRCAGCRDTRPLAELHAYVQAPGVVLRCASCRAVQLRLVRGPGRAWVDLRGVELLEIPLPGRA